MLVALSPPEHVSQSLTEELQALRRTMSVRTSSLITSILRLVASGPAERDESKLHDGPDPGQRIPKDPDLLAFLERPGPVVHRNLQGRITFADQLDDQLVVEVEAVTLEIQPIQAVAPAQ